MRIIHTSDVHLGSPISAHLDAARAHIRRRELQDSFARLTRRAVELGAEGFIIAGDLFDREFVSRRLIETTLATIASTPGITFFYLPGNHEGDALSASGISLPDNLRIFGKEWTYFKLGELTVCGRSLLSHDMFDSFCGGTGCIAVLHGELRDGASSDTVIGARDVAFSNINYLALGHYHAYSAKELGGRCTAVYSGTPEGRGFDEVGERGFVLIDVSDGKITHSFIPSAARRLRIVEADISGDRTQSEIEATVGRALLGVSREDMVRVVLVGEHTEDTLRDTESIQRRFSSEFFYFEAKDKSRLYLRPEELAGDRSLRGEFVRLVMADGNLTPEERDGILECGLRALEGEAVYGRSGY